MEMAQQTEDTRTARHRRQIGRVAGHLPGGSKGVSTERTRRRPEGIKQDHRCIPHLGCWLRPRNEREKG